MSQSVEESNKSAPMSAAERKRAQRERDKSRGYVEITVRVPEDRIDEVRASCAKLKPKRRARRDQSPQIDIEDILGGGDVSRPNAA